MRDWFSRNDVLSRLDISQLDNYSDMVKVTFNIDGVDIVEVT